MKCDLPFRERIGGMQGGCGSLPGDCKRYRRGQREGKIQGAIDKTHSSARPRLFQGLSFFMYGCLK